MKKVAMLFILVAVASTAQAWAQGELAWGVKAGFNGSTFYGDDSNMMKTRYGAVVGGYVEYPVTDLISLQGEVLYVMTGWKNKDYGVIYEINQKINYVEIPLLIRINSPCGDVIGPYLVMGPAFGFKAGSDFEVKVMGSVVDVTAEDFALTEPKGTEFGFVLGGGVSIPAGNYTVGFEVRGSGGLTDTYENRETSQGSKEIVAKPVGVSMVFTVAF